MIGMGKGRGDPLEVINFGFDLDPRVWILDHMHHRCSF